MPASSQASSELSTASLIVVSSAFEGLSKPSRWRFLTKNSETEISRCFCASDSAVTRGALFARAALGAGEAGSVGSGGGAALGLRSCGARAACGSWAPAPNRSSWGSAGVRPRLAPAFGLGCFATGF